MTTLEAYVRARFVADGSEPFALDVDLAVEAGETLVVLGPSGSGKTLLLETVAGFHRHEGSVRAGGRDLTGRPPERRGFGFVFQDYALFPHLSVRENVAYGARYHDDTRDPDALLAELGVDHLAERAPPTLSGGERQRVALARALCIRPAVMLLDEPLAALDVPTRQALRDELTDILADVTAVYVTHNRTTARAVGDRLAVMQAGTVVQTGSPEAVFERPVSPAVAAFTGANVVPLAASPTLRDLLDGAASGTGRGDGDGAHVAVRPEAVALGGPGDVAGTVTRSVREEGTHRVTVAFDDATVEAFTTDPPGVGEPVGVSFPPDRLHRC